MQAESHSPRASNRPQTAVLVPAPLLLAILLAFTLMALRIGGTPSPLMGGDEYAYLQTAHFDQQQDTLFRLDPYMQRVDNRVTPWLYRAADALAPGHAADAWRLLNALTFCAGALVVFAALRRALGERPALATSVLYLLFPFSFYATLLLPEVQFQLFIYALVFLWTRRAGPPSLTVSALAAVLCGMGYLIKPHAMAAVLSSAVFLALMDWRYAPGPATQRVATGLAKAVGFIILTVLAMKIWRVVLSASHGQDAIVSSFYASYLKRLADPGYLLQHLGIVCGYVIAHFGILLVFFAPGLAWLARHAWLVWRPSAWRRREPAPEASMLTFVALFAVALVGMVALFTDVATAVDPGEAWRLHGRYLSALLPLLLGVSVAAATAQRRYRGWVAASAIVAGGLVAVICNRWLHVYPWDYPDLFGVFYAVEGRWSFPGALTWPPLLTGVAALAGGIAYAMRARAWPYIAFFVVAMLAAQAQMRAWVSNQAGVAAPISDDGAAVADYLGSKASTGTGVIVTRARWGEVTYLLARLDSLQHVLMPKGPGAVTAQDLPANVTWAIAEPGVDMDLPGAARLKFGAYRLFLLGGDVPWPEVGEPDAWNGSPIEIALSALQAGVHIEGFNDAESWGAWSANTEAAIVLPSMVKGRLTIRFFGWVPQPDGADVSIVIGDASTAVRLTDTGADYEVTLTPSDAADRILIRAANLTDAGPRRLGVAIARLSISRAP